MRIHLTIKKDEEVSLLEKRICTLEKELEDRQKEIYRLHQYAASYLRVCDELKAAKKAMEKAGLDTRTLRIK